MRQWREEDSDHDWRGWINTPKANTWSYFKLRKITSCRLFVGERRHIIRIRKKPRFQSHAARRILWEQKKLLLWMNSPSGVWWASLKEMPKAGDLSTSDENIINLGLTRNKTCILLSTCYGSPVTRGKREKKRLCKIPSKWTYNWSIFEFLLLYSCWRE